MLGRVSTYGTRRGASHVGGRDSATEVKVGQPDGILWRVKERASSAERSELQLHIPLVQEDTFFVQEELRSAIGAPYNAAAVVDVLSRFRTWFHLPHHVVGALKRDAGSQHLVSYLQTLLHRRYEQLSRGVAKKRRRSARSKAVPPRSRSK